MVAGLLIAGSSGCGAHQDAERMPGGTAAPVISSSRVTRTPSPGAGCAETAALNTWSLQRRAAQLVVVPVEENAVLSAQPLAAKGAGGVILFGSYAPAALPANLARLRQAAASDPPLLVMTDEEGGEVQRMANLVGSLPWPRTIAATMTTAQARALAEQAGRRMRAAGVTMDLAPVLDLSDSPGPDAADPDGPRSFSIHASVATAYGLAFARGLQEGGVIPVVKHFPGLGQASYNSDFGPASVPPLQTLKARALRPFAAAIRAGLPAVMVGNVSVPGLTGTLPASLSPPAITGLLRHELGFRGLILTDSLSALAVHDAGYSVPQAAVHAVEAGADMVLFNSASPVATADHVIARIVAAVTSGRLPVPRLDEAVQHVLEAKNVSACP
ncbi:MAG: glycoside hydrolase family 3 protein [Streptosporangiaceae bacterium]